MCRARKERVNPKMVIAMAIINCNSILNNYTSWRGDGQGSKGEPELSITLFYANVLDLVGRIFVYYNQPQEGLR